MHNANEIRAFRTSPTSNADSALLRNSWGLCSQNTCKHKQQKGWVIKNLLFFFFSSSKWAELNALLVNQALKWHVGRVVAPCAALQQECYACILTFNYLKVNDCYLAWHTCQQFTLVLLKYLLCYSIKNESTEAKNENIPYHMTPLLPVACQLHKDLFTKRC